MLKGKVALVTGGTKGIGKATAVELAKLGCDLALVYFKSRNAAEATQKEIEALGVRVALIRANLATAENIPKVVNTVKEKFGKCDIFISNAAMGVLKKAVDITAEDWDLTLNANAKAMLLIARDLVKIIPDGGKIVSITSHGPYRYIPEYSAMAAAKASIEALTRYLAFELAPRRINVNAVRAGIVESESLRAFPSYGQMVEWSIKHTPFGRIGRPEDIAPVVAFLCTDAAQWITGQIITVDGGFSIV